MPHSNFKERYHPLNSEVMKCTRGQTFVFGSDRRWNMKIRLHNKVCSKLVEGYEQVRVPKKAMMSRGKQHNEAERMRKVYENH